MSKQHLPSVMKRSELSKITEADIEKMEKKKRKKSIFRGLIYKKCNDIEEVFVIAFHNEAARKKLRRNGYGRIILIEEFPTSKINGI